MTRARQVANFDPALFAADEISGDKVSGGTIGAGTLGGTSIVNTSGSITTTGAFTSVGITDGAVGATAITIDDNENVGIGLTNPSDFNDSINNLVVGSIASGSHGITIATHSTSTGYLSFADGATTAADEYRGLIEYDHSTNKMHFRTDASQRLTIDSDGRMGINCASSTQGILATFSTDNEESLKLIHNTGSYPYGINVNFNNASPDDNIRWFFICIDSTTTRFKVFSDGDCQNHDNSYGSISDERIKEDIKDANSQWDDIKALKVRNFKRKDDVAQYGENAWEQIGLVAQEVELVSPKLIDESDPSDFELEHCGFGEQNSDGEWVVKQDENGKDMTVKGMKYSVLYMKAVKALQEAMERIEQLEAKVTALENA